jgi:RHS repeat-associated protein
LRSRFTGICFSPAANCNALPVAAAVTVYFGAVEVRNWKVAGAEQVLTYPHPWVKLVNGTGKSWLHRDYLGSVRAITDAVGAKVEAAIYKPFGEQSEWLLPGNAAPETKGWIGERFDADAGLQYLNARYYDPELGLFLQPDWFEVTKAGVGTNRFSYSFNDPVNKMDSGGNCVWDACIVEAAYVVGAIVASVLAVDAAVDIANGPVVGDSPLGNPLGKTVEMAAGIGHNEGPSLSEGLSSGNPGVDGLFGGFDNKAPGGRQGQSYPGTLGELNGKLKEFAEGVPGAKHGPTGGGGYQVELPDGTKISTTQGELNLGPMSPSSK